jgi:hypothetical protein
VWRWSIIPNKLHIKKTVYIILLLCVTSFAVSQEKGKGPKEKTIKQELKSNKKIRQEAKEKRKKERAEKKAIKKHHKRIQTKKVRKRMGASKKKAARNNENRREFFVKRWINKLKK